MALLTRDALVKQMLDASTVNQVKAAKRAAAAWLREHPNDTRVLSAGEQLAMVGGALQALSKEHRRSA